MHSVLVGVHEKKDEEKSLGGSELNPGKDKSVDWMRHVLIDTVSIITQVEEVKPYFPRKNRDYKPLHFVPYVLPSVNLPMIFQFIKGTCMGLLVNKLAP